MTDADHRDHLRRSTLAGVRWIGGARLVAETMALASSIVLARLIPPAEFGRAAVALIVVALAIIIGPAGLTAVLVQRRELAQAHLEAAGFLSLAVGAAATGSTLAFAATAGPSLFGDEIARLLELAAPAWLISSAGAVSQAMLQRALDFRRVAVLETIGVLGGTGTGVALAAAGFGARALVLGGLVGLATGTVLALAWARPPLPRPHARALVEVGTFAAPAALSSLVYSMFRNVDYAILGARLPPADVGYYYRAYQLGVDYQSKLSQIMMRVSFPVYSRSRSLEELRELCTRIVRVHATVLVPLIAAFVGVAPIAVPWIYGSAWAPSVVPAQIIAVAGIGHALTTGTGPILVATGRLRTLLAWNTLELVSYAVLIFVLSSHSLLAVAIGVASFGAIVAVVNQTMLIGPILRLSPRELARDVAPGFAAGAAVLGVVVALRAAFGFLGLDGLHPLPLLVALALACAATYAAVLRVLFPAVWHDLGAVAGRVTGRPGS